MNPSLLFRTPSILVFFLICTFATLKTALFLGYLGSSENIKIVEYIIFLFSLGLFYFTVKWIAKILNFLDQTNKKNSYLEHAAKILRHDMHSGINTYIPRGLSSLDRRVSEDQKKELKIDSSIKMIRDGLLHTQKVYKGVYEFTNLVKENSVLSKSVCDLHKILEDYLQLTSYRNQVKIGDLGECSVNEPLFCTAIDNFVRNGLKYNDSLNKEIIIRREGNNLFIEDNGRGMSSEDFKTLSKEYVRKEGQKEEGSGLGLNISLSIIEEHGFEISCDKKHEGGTQIKIKLK